MIFSFYFEIGSVCFNKSAFNVVIHYPSWCVQVHLMNNRRHKHIFFWGGGGVCVIFAFLSGHFTSILVSGSLFGFFCSFFFLSQLVFSVNICPGRLRFVVVLSLILVDLCVCAALTRLCRHFASSGQFPSLHFSVVPHLSLKSTMMAGWGGSGTHSWSMPTTYDLLTPGK